MAAGIAKNLKLINESIFNTIAIQRLLKIIIFFLIANFWKPVASPVRISLLEFFDLKI